MIPRSPFKKFLALGLALLLLWGGLGPGLGLAETPEGWLSFRTEDLEVLFPREGYRLLRLKGPGLEGAYPRALIPDFQARAVEMEEWFQEVEQFLGLDYDPEELGRIYVFVYPSLEEYQEASGCLICAANIGGFLREFRPEVEELIRRGEVNPLAVYLTLESGEYVVLHEFTHVLDFSLIPNDPPTFLLEGLATYTGYRLDGVPDGWQLGLGEQFLKLFLDQHGFDLFRDYFSRGGYWKFTYEVGAGFVRFLVARGGWARFLRFYRELRSPYHQREGLEGLFRRYYGAGLVELEAEWKRALSEVEVTANARAAYEFKLDQILIRYIFLRPLLVHPRRAEELFEAARTLVEGEFNEVAGAALRDYLNDQGNLHATLETAAEALDYGGYLRDYVRSYHSDRPELIKRFTTEFAELTGLYRSGKLDEFVRLYWQLVQTYVTWRI